ncbi:hypothetical protein F4806DRAFT_397786 [Annulohypoxylon nitens]|nr:hypothetical protein F4806DRAFT_397786 [Annulohypoxylon nitens]
MGGPQLTERRHCFCYAFVRSWLSLCHTFIPRLIPAGKRSSLFICKVSTGRIVYILPTIPAKDISKIFNYLAWHFPFGFTLTIVHVLLTKQLRQRGIPGSDLGSLPMDTLPRIPDGKHRHIHHGSVSNIPGFDFTGYNFPSAQFPGFQSSGQWHASQWNILA